MVKTYENTDEILELSADDAELLLCKQVLKPSNFEYTQFIFNHFNPSWLKTNESQDLFKISKTYFDKYKTILPLNLYEKIFNNDKYSVKSKALKSEFDRIVNFDDSTFDNSFIKNTLKTYVRSRAVYFAIMSNIDSIQNEGKVANIISAFEKIYQADLDENVGIEYFTNLEEHCRKLTEKTNRIQFGFERFDKFTYGGLPSDDTCLFLFLAQPGLGKSQIMMNIAYNWVMMNKKVLIISLEMSEEMYSRRFDALFADISPNKLKENIGPLKQKVRGVKAGIPRGELRIKEFPTGTMNTIMLKQYLKKLETTYNFVPDIIFVDYLNIMRPDVYGPNTSLYEKCGKISEELRALSGEKKIPIVSAVQSNRQSTGGGYPGANIDIGNVSESAGIVATADAMFALFQEEGDREIGKINVKILKNRLGGYVGEYFPLKVNYETLKMFNWEDDKTSEDDTFEESEDVTYKNMDESSKQKFEDL